MAGSETPNLLAKLKTNVGLWFVIGMAALLAVRLILLLSEGGATQEATVSPDVAHLTRRLTSDPAQATSIPYLMMVKTFTPWKDFNDSDFNLLAHYNMFDPKLVQSAPQMERNADEKVTEAQRAFDAGNFPQARSLVREALGMQPNHLRAHMLLKQIEDKLSTGTATTTGTATRSGTRPTTAPAAGRAG